MDTRHLVDPELLAALELFPRLDMTAETLPGLRASARALLPPPPDDPDIRLSERRIPGPVGAPDVRVLIYEPTQSAGPRPALLHIHGGGYLTGMPETSDARHRGYVRDLACVVVSVDYRLAPETPFPGPVEDCYAALKWLHAEAAALGVDRDRIAVGGESAGGGLAATLALLARDRGEVPLAFQLLVYPMLDDRTEGSHPYTGEFVWTPERNAAGWNGLLAGRAGAADISPYAAAARAEDLAGLPPSFIGTCALDLLMEENMEYARRLARAGVPVELHVYPGAYHGFERAVEARVTRQALRDYKEALRVAFS